MKAPQLAPPARPHLARALAAVTDRSEADWARQIAIARGRGTRCVFWYGADRLEAEARSVAVDGAPARLTCDSGPEAWERMVTAGLIPESALHDPQRLFACELDAPDRPGGAFAATHVPARIARAVLLAADWPNVLAVEQIARHALRLFQPGYANYRAAWCAVTDAQMRARIAAMNPHFRANHEMAELGYVLGDLRDKYALFAMFHEV